ncbi:hypothetical protein H7849_05000 [Alloacidobacterium dinghuense]|uniref:DUF4352 domain-containing protein n=1 Tax=Alloacidobacterium dinghuense TaxID=2763107 RepID=A0A7G8BLA1_9BACT|nr:hypothetical protein [Alloacidobacterium dinghuense]QNI33321.1 hypothetical protein H7849_05000 [Alloacidobacterium dinghuense]
MDEERNSGKRSLLIVLVATVIVVVTIAAYVYIDEKPPVVAGQILKLDITPIHTEMRVGAGAQGVQGGMDTYDQLLITAEVQVRNQGTYPIYLHDMWSNLTTSTGDQERCLAANNTDFQSVFVAYPQMASFKAEPLLRDITLQPGQIAHGLVIFHYPMTKDQWDARHSFQAVLAFTNQKDLVLPWPAPPGK